MVVRQSISRIFTSLADETPDRVVARDDSGVLTASQLDRASNRLARAYLDLGVEVDSLVTVALPNTLEFVIVCAAIWKCGATPQPLSPQSNATERAELEVLARPSLVVGLSSVNPSVPWVPAGWTPPEELSDAVMPDVWASSWKAPTSSGSTGRPKIVKAAGPALFDASQPVAPFLPRDQVQLVTGPMTHSAPFTYAFRGLMTGHTLVILPRFDERHVLRAIDEHRVTWALLVPTMMHRLLRLPEHERASVRLDTLETVLHMGAACAPELKRRFMEWVGPERVVEVYAGSESNGIVMIRGDEWLRHPGSVGRPVSGTALSIRSMQGGEAQGDEAQGDEVPVGAVGEIWLRRDGAAAYNYLGATSRRTADGWDTLGDIGRLDDDGYLYIVDRADDVIVRGGVRVHPAEIEQTLEMHPAVRGAVAFGVADAQLGQRIECVVDIAGETVAAADLLSWVRARVDASRCVAAVHVVDEPVRNDAGKARRRSYAQLFG